MASSTKPNLTLCPALLATTLFSVRRIGQARDERAPLSLLATAFQAGGTAALSVAGLSGLLATAQTPASHASTHNAGGSDALAIDAVAATGSLRTLGTGATQACAGNDSRLSNARTPAAHAASHQSGGSDALALDTLAATTDTTALNVSISAHGLAPKLPNDATKFLNGVGAYAVPSFSGLTNPLAAGSLGAGALQLVAAGDGLYQPAAHVVGVQANSLDVAYFEAAASAVNYLRFINSATGNRVQILAAGSDTDIGIQLVPKGAGAVTVPNGTAGLPGLRFVAGGNAKYGFYATGAGSGQLVLATDSTNLIFFNGSFIILPSGSAFRFSSTNDPTGPPDSQIFRGGPNALTIAYGGIPGTLTSGSLIPGSNVQTLGVAATGWGALYVDYTNTATVGAVTINKPSGRVNIAASGTSVVVTNSLVTAASHVLVAISTNDATATIKNVVPTAGSFTITLTAAATAQVSIDFLVVNAD
jgi:hypothetical protein